jgi:RNA-directed DNA polymerase
VKRIGGLWRHLTAFDNLLFAYRKARCGKSRSPQVQAFALDLERNLLRLQRELIHDEYQPGRYRLFTIYERKPRNIAAAPFRDRVVHHAILNLIEGPIDQRFIYDSYACRAGKGVHTAVDRYQHWSRKYPYVLKMDIEQYFPSIDHGLLKETFRRYLKDRAMLALLDRIVDGSPAVLGRTTPCYFVGDDLLTPLVRPCGLPIGNLTSQFFANLFLDGFDHWLKEQCGVHAYLRYVDDFTVLGRDKEQLHELREMIAERLSMQRLRLHPRKAHIYHTARGIDLLGYHVFPHKRRLRADNGHRFARKLCGFARAYRAGRMKWEDFNPSVQSWIGHARHADTEGLRRFIFDHTVFQRGQCI